MNPPTNYKQETIKNMIKKRYNHLLELCEQTKQEITYLDQNADNVDFQKSGEIEKTRSLIASIEREIQIKQWEFYNTEVKNRYQQLMGLYHRTQEEIMILENTLGHERALSAGSADYARLNGTSEQSLLPKMENHSVGLNEGLPVVPTEPKAAHDPFTNHLNLADRLAFEEEKKPMDPMVGREALIAQATHNLKMKEAQQQMPNPTNRTRLNLNAQPNELTNEEMRLEQLLAERFSADK